VEYKTIYNKLNEYIMLQSINPFNQKVIRNYKEHSQNEINYIITEVENEF
jgi:hypothetical protein